MIEHFARGYSEDDLTPTLVKQCGFACGSMGMRDVKIYCNEVSGSFETYSIATLVRLYDCGHVSADYVKQEAQRRGLHET